MNHGTNINLRCDPNGDLTLTNDDGSITLHKDGTVTLATVASIELMGPSLGKLDGAYHVRPADVIELLAQRGKKA